MRLMVRATRQAFAALRAHGNDRDPHEPAHSVPPPDEIVIGYWRRVLTSPRGELWFGAHSRAAPEEMHELADELQETCATPGAPRLTSTRLLAPRL